MAELTWNTFRDHLILEYEIPKYDGDLGQPGLFVPLRSELYQKKVRYIMDTFQSQHAKHWFREDIFRPSCGCVEWNAMLPAATQKLSTAASWC